MLAKEHFVNAGMWVMLQLSPTLSLGARTNAILPPVRVDLPSLIPAIYVLLQLPPHLPTPTPLLPPTSPLLFFLSLRPLLRLAPFAASQICLPSSFCPSRLCRPILSLSLSLSLAFYLHSTRSFHLR